MPLLRSDILCPYCLERLRHGDVKLICNRCGTEAVLTRTDMLLNRLPRCKQPGCNNAEVSDQYCNHCSEKIPPDIMECSKYLRFSLLGLTGCGKTCYLTSMLHELRTTQGSPLILSHMDNATKQEFSLNEEMIFGRQEPVDATPNAMPKPQLWRIRDKTKMTNTSIPAYSLTIYDGAGENSKNIDPTISRYISGSKALVILFDPLSLYTVRDMVDKDVADWSVAAGHDMELSGSASMVDGLANYIRQTCNISSNKLIDRNVAVVFTKIDVLKDQFGTATVMQPSPHLAKRGFVKADADAVDAEIRDWLTLQGETAFLEAVETNFRKDKVQFFGVSSFGQPPTGQNRLGKPVPHRVLDPLMWMLSKEKIIPVI